MTDLFISLFNMSITASWLVLAVVVLRLLLKKAPKWINAVLWAFVGFRLVCPFSFESIFSLVPSTETVPADIVYSSSPAIHSGIPALNSTINPIISETFAPDVTNSVNPLQVGLFVVVIVWLSGIFAMLIYSGISYIRLNRKVREGVGMKDNIWLCDRIDTPFILGLFRPRIFLPSGMSESDMDYVIAHEKAHLRRRDHWWKPLGFILLTVYWFNPVMWLAYILLCRDIELACDEKVIKEMGTDIKKSYSEALINCSVSRRTISACPLAFGETGVKDRIKSVLSYKKPALWIIIIAVISCIVVGVCFLTNPKPELKDSNPELDRAVSQAIFEINSSRELYNTECVAEGHIIYGYEEEGDNVTVYLQEEFAGFGFKNGYFMEQTGHCTPAVFTFVKNDDGYILTDHKYVMPGEGYGDSIREMFPKKYQSRVLDPTEKDNADMWAQCVAYAKDYLEKIGRKAEVCHYSEVPHVMLTDVGVSVEISNKILENNTLSCFDADIGNYETLENGVRFVYRTDFDKEKNLIIYTREIYATGEITQKIELDAATGRFISNNTYDCELPEPETDFYGSIYTDKYEHLDKLDYMTAGKVVKEMSDKYSITAIHYPKSDESESAILVGEAYCNEAAYFLNHVNWKRSSAPINPLSSPGSVEFVIDENYRVTVYARKKGSLFAYATVKSEDEIRYYHASYGDYKDAAAILHSPENISETSVEWTYSPYMSATWHGFFTVDFNLDYTHIVTSCKNGKMVNLDTEKQPRRKSMRFEKGEKVYWEPDYDVLEHEDYTAEVNFTVYNEKEKLYSGIIKLICVERTQSAVFKVFMQDSDGLVLTQGDMGAYIIKKENFSIAPVSGHIEYLYSNEHDASYLSLNPDTKQAIFSLSRLSSNIIEGTYQDYIDRIFILSNDKKQKYIFRKKDSDLIFSADESTPVPEYKYSTDGKPVPCVPDGAVFEYLGYKKGYIDKTTTDIDGDGIKEDCILGYGPTSGLFTVTFSVYENGYIEYFNIFNSPVSEIQFGADNNGNVVIKGKAFSDFDNIGYAVYEISIKDGNIVLGSGDSMMAYWGKQGLDSPYAPK